MDRPRRRLRVRKPQGGVRAGHRGGPGVGPARGGARDRRPGGPASYIEDGRTGRLVDTLDRHALGRAIVDVLDLVDLPGRADRAERLVDERYTVEAMAGALVPVYESARQARALAPA